MTPVVLGQGCRKLEAMAEIGIDLSEREGHAGVILVPHVPTCAVRG